MRGAPAASILVLTLLVLTPVACGGGGSDAGPLPDRGPRMPAVELGTGAARFEPIPDAGGTVELVAGPQGGFHLDVSARLVDLSPDGLRLVYEARDDERVWSLPTEIDLTRSSVVPEGQRAYLRVGDLLVLDIDEPTQVEGRTVALRVTARAADGEMASDERAVRIVDDE
ncbi:MAG: hypothetical protein ACFCGT_20385 [Sandaracinaceae bacterium]